MKDSDWKLTVPVLTYHQVMRVRRSDIMARGLVVDANSFGYQMFILRSLGYRTVSLSDLADALLGKTVLPKRAVVITFDDGYEGTYRAAFPILQRYGFTGTLFLIAEDFCGHAKSENKRAFPILTHQQVFEMINNGFHIGSHSVSHARLTELPVSQEQSEIESSKKILEDRFGCALTAFCYPYGLHSRDMEKRVEQAGYASGCSIRFGRHHRPADRFVLKRIAVGRDQGLIPFLYRLRWARDE